MPLKNPTLYRAGSTAATEYAAVFLEDRGMRLLSDLSSAPDYLLLDVPAFNSDGLLRSGQNAAALIAQLPEDTTVIGGNLEHQALARLQKLDLLKDAFYLAENARITAECALDVALPYLSVTLRQCPVLVLGWGRIGKCLSQLLQRLDAQVTVAARKESDRAMLRALGFEAADFHIPDLRRFRLIFNTVAAPVLTPAQLHACRSDCVKIDLASAPGMEDVDAIVARGLPGIHFPESSGKLIAETIMRKESIL